MVFSRRGICGLFDECLCLCFLIVRDLIVKDIVLVNNLCIGGVL